VIGLCSLTGSRTRVPVSLTINKWNPIEDCYKLRAMSIFVIELTRRKTSQYLASFSVILSPLNVIYSPIKLSYRSSKNSILQNTEYILAKREK
jgi:hypothetical protein